MVRPTDHAIPPDEVAPATAATAAPPLADGAAPAILLPVRLETRWFEVGSPTELELRVRIFPDELHVPADDHDAPTAHERALAIAWWQARDAAPDGDAVAAAWQALVTAARPGRAAWLTRTFAPRATTPTQPPDVPPLPAGSPPTGVRALPDRWYVVGRRAEQTVFTATTAPVRPGLRATPDPADQPSASDRPAVGAQLDWLTAYPDAVAAGMAVSIRVARVDAEALDELIVVGLATTAGPESTALADLLAAHGRAGELALVADDAATNHTAEVRAAAPALAAGTIAAAGSALAELTSALGVPAEATRDAARDDHARDAVARAMATLIWPTTWGHFLAAMVGAPATAVEAARRLALDHLRPDGRWPILRVRDQPYGVLAATAPSRWPATAPGATLAGLLDELRRRWRPLLAGAPRLDDGGDLDRALVEVLRRGPRSVGWAARPAYGQEPAAVLLADRTGASLATVYQGLDRARARHRTSLDAIAARTPMSGPLPELVFEAAPLRVRVPPVAPPSADRDRPLVDNYLAILGDPATSAATLRAHAIAGAGPRPLLYLLARHAVLSAWAAAADRVLKTRGQATVGSVWDRVARAGLDGGRGDDLGGLRAAARTLAGRPVGELERLLAGYLDAASHRLDAWVAALATERLAAQRSARPRAAWLGGWGWLERPRPGRSTRPSADGYVHAPSLAQARSAAVLRAAFDAHQHDRIGPSLALDLTAERVHAARALLDDLRAGRSLAHSLGLWIEAWLTDHGQGGQIGPLRLAVAEASPGVDARALPLDGVRAFRRWNRPAPQDDVDPRLVTALRDRLDAVADLLLADGVHHAVHGDGVRAGLALDALERGDGPIPEPQLDRAVVDGPHRRWRVVLALAAGSSWPGTADCARAIAAPRLDAWAASALGPPTARTFRFTVGDGPTRQVTLADLGLCALDVATTVATAGLDGLATLAAARLGLGAAPVAAVADDDGDLVAVLAAAIGTVIRAARPLAAGDLGTTSSAAPPPLAPGALQAALADDDPVRAAALVGLPPLAHDPDALAGAVAARRALAATAPWTAAMGAEAAPPARTAAHQTTAVADAPPLTAWLADLARVRPHLDPLELLALLAPHAVAGQRRRTDDGVALVVVGTGTLDDELVVLDDWTELAPAPTATTGVALPFDAPRAQPPQTILLAVAPPERAWTVELLAATIAETVEVARLRAVDPAHFHDQVLPTIYLPDDPAEAVATVDLRAVAVQLPEVAP